MVSGTFLPILGMFLLAFPVDEKRVDYAAAVDEGSSLSSSSLVEPEQSSMSSSVAVTERTNRSMMRGCSSSSIEV